MKHGLLVNGARGEGAGAAAAGEAGRVLSLCCTAVCCEQTHKQNLASTLQAAQASLQQYMLNFCNSSVFQKGIFFFLFFFSGGKLWTERII